MLRPEPAADWCERIDPDEEERHRLFAEQIVAVQERVSRKERAAGRAFHRKQIAGLSGTVTVTASHPQLRHGLFARPGTLPAQVRMSNGAIRRQADAIPDIRGLAISVRGVAGESALGGTTDRQDFLLINRPAFGFRDSRDFAELLAPSTAGQAALVRFFVGRYGPVQGPVRLASLMKDLLRPFTGFATTTFFSAAPIAYGPYAVMVRAVPRGARINPLAASDWSRDVAVRLRQGPLHYDLQVQFYLDAETTPIEDLRTPWPQDRSPFRTVAVLTIPEQDPDSAEGRELARSIEADRFDPWAALASHRPLGEVMRARKAAYYASTRARAEPGAHDPG